MVCLKSADCFSDDGGFPPLEFSAASCRQTAHLLSKTSSTTGSRLTPTLSPFECLKAPQDVARTLSVTIRGKQVLAAGPAALQVSSPLSGAEGAVTVETHRILHGWKRSGHPPHLPKRLPGMATAYSAEGARDTQPAPCLFLTQKRGSEWLPRAVVLRAAFCFPVSIDVILRV